ncbi:MAG: hypothetical protein MUE68_05440 [Bacteroidetes bacterium]|jgi:hypothetical protein|nr:hypothetical protein [Bacteroidota bacterium]
MAEKKNILLRLDKELYASIAKWAADDLRSINGQLEFLLTEAVKRAGRQRTGPADDASPPPEQP